MDIAEIYDRYARQLYRHALAITSRGADADDALQTVFLRLAASERRRRRIDDVESYLHVAVRHAAIEILRQRRRAPAGLEDPARSPSELGSIVTATNGTDPDEVDRLNRALCRLPPEQREIVVLHVYEGLTFRRVGELLEVSPDTAASRFRYAKEKLKEWLGGH